MRHGSGVGRMGGEGGEEPRGKGRGTGMDASAANHESEPSFDFCLNSL